MSVSSTSEIIADIRAGRMVILVDDEDRENEGDLVLAAQRDAGGDQLHGQARPRPDLPDADAGAAASSTCRRWCRTTSSPHGTAFTVSIEAAEGVTTGISAHDRARTVQAAVARNAKPADIVQPGHIFPLMAQNGGVLVRAGHTEAGCDLAQLAGLEPAAVICEILKDDGTMARLPDLIEFRRRTTSRSAPSPT
jgi:3,4-dihydroxy 2-butanone 4-phosphate synthase/GTP cyclohydrolase II